MRHVLLVISVAALLMPTVASAEVIGSWSKVSAGPGLDRWMLTVTPSQGIVMAGFDLALHDTALTGPFAENGFAFGLSKGTSTPGTVTQFLLQLSHGSGPNAVTDVNAQSPSIDEDYLIGVFGAAKNGIYDQGNGIVGWTSSLPLLAIVVPAASDPFSLAADGALTGLTFQNSDYDGPGAFYHPDGTLEAIRFMAVPEPDALILLACGLIGLLAYAWRKQT